MVTQCKRSQNGGGGEVAGRDATVAACTRGRPEPFFYGSLLSQIRLAFLELLAVIKFCCLSQFVSLAANVR